MLIFMLGSLALLIFISYAHPFDSAYQNRIEILNEFNVLLVGYLACMILYSSYNPKMIDQIGILLNYVIVGGVLLNVVLIVYMMIFELKNKFLHSVQQCVVKSRMRKRNNKLRKLKKKGIDLNDMQYRMRKYHDDCDKIIQDYKDKKAEEEESFVTEESDLEMERASIED